MKLVDFDYSALRGKIKEVIGTETKFAGILGVSSVSLSAKLNNRVGFSESEIYKSCEILKIPIDEVSLYFFANKLKKT